MRAFIARTVRAVRLLARERQLPRPLRWLALLGVAPIPGPVDEAVLLVVALILWLFYRDILTDAWRRAQETPQARIAARA